MKRALAERASKSVGAPASASSLTSSSASAPLHVASSNLSSHSRKRPDSKSSSKEENHRKQLDEQRSSKRKKVTPTSSEDNNNQSDSEDKNEGSAYFLRFQNKALAAEMYQLKHKLSMVESEIQQWRKTGSDIRKGVENIHREWRSSVGTICGIIYSLGVMRQQFYPIRKRKSPKLDDGISESAYIDTPSSLLKTVANIASSFEALPSHSRIIVNNEEIDLQNLHDLSQHLNNSNSITSSFDRNDKASDVESTLREGLTCWVEKVALPTLVYDCKNDDDDITENDVLNLSRLHKQLATLQHNICAYRNKLEEVVKERDEAKTKEKRIRRGLHRIAAGYLKVEDVMKDIEKDAVDEDLLCPESNHGAPDPVVSSSLVTSIESSAITPTKSETLAKSEISPSGAVEVTKEVKELDALCECRNERIKELLVERELLQKQINDLVAESVSMKQTDSSVKISPDIVMQTDTYIETVAKLVTAERKVSDLMTELEEVRQKWARCKGECELTSKTMKDMNEKHAKRWKILTEEKGDAESLEDDCGNNCNDELFENIDDDDTTKSTEHENFKYRHKKYVLLEYKLNQALEGVRQVEALRVALTEASKMNDCLQSQVSEWKSKYTTLSSKKSSTRDLMRSSSTSSSSSTKGDINVERLKQDFRICRKELLAANQARENYKSKNERLEKDREYIMRTNVRLIKQSTEKEEMNTKSLSTILQLKNIADLRSEEVDVLKQKVKAAEQLGLAARLVQNAKMRIDKETEAQEKETEDKLKRLHVELDDVKTKKELSDARLSQSQIQIKSAGTDLGAMKTRCDELVAECNATLGEKHKLMESLLVAKREVKENEKKIKCGKDSQGHTSGSFSIDQLSTQLSFLKKRLACPVCNDRDKEVILLRCRHMFCKHCIDENIKNRSRKCPACGQRFDTKDVGDVWL